MVIRIALLGALGLLGGCDLLFQLTPIQADAGSAGDGRGSDGGGPDAAPPLGDAPPGSRTVFVTFAQHMGNLGGLTGADTICQIAAAGVSLPGTFKAWLSSSTMSAGGRMTVTDGPFLLSDTSRTPVATTWNKLLSGNLLHAIDVTEQGFVVSGSCDVWTNTSYTGATKDTSTGADCIDWTTSVPGSVVVAAGSTSASDLGWTEHAPCSVSCSSSLRLYCIEQ